MKSVLAILFFSLSLSAFAQSDVDRITLSTFSKPDDHSLLDTIKKLLPSGGYKNYIGQEKEVYNKAAKLDRFEVVKSLLKKLSDNGTEDVSKCFTPRYSINFYKGPRLVKYVLICFECYGLRFSDERWITKNKGEKKRMDLMDELKARFVSEGY